MKNCKLFWILAHGATQSYPSFIDHREEENNIDRNRPFINEKFQQKNKNKISCNFGIRKYQKYSFSIQRYLIQTWTFQFRSKDSD